MSLKILAGNSFDSHPLMRDEPTSTTMTGNISTIFWAKVPSTVELDPPRFAAFSNLRNQLNQPYRITVSLVDYWQAEMRSFVARTLVSSLEQFEWEDRWLMFSYQTSSASTVEKLRILDQTGTIIDTVEWGSAGASTIPQFVTICGEGDLVVEYSKIAEYAIVKRHFTDAELIDIATNFTLGTFDNFVYYPMDSENAGVHTNLGTENFNLVVPEGWEFDEDGPKAPLNLSGVTTKSTGHDFLYQGVTSGTIYGVRWENGATAPTNAEIINGTGAGFLEHASGAVAKGGQVSLQFSGGNSFTEYDYYFVHVDGASTEYRDLSDPNYTTSGGVTLQLADTSEVTHLNLTGINWAWFDGTDAGLFTSPTDKGQGLSTDDTGNITFHLPNSSLLAGQSGTLVLDCIDGPDTYSGSYILAVG